MMANLTPDAQRAFERCVDVGELSLTEAVRIHREEFRDIEFNLRMVDPEVWQHDVWQKLFTIYRLFGCPVEDMHDMLCDFNNIQRLFREEFKYEFYWYFDPSYRLTIFDIKPRHDEVFGVHVRGDEDGAFTLRHLFSVQVHRGNEEDCVGDSS